MSDLIITQHDFGWQQECFWKHQDRAEEELEDILHPNDGVLVPIYRENECYNNLKNINSIRLFITGDQNAGKSHLLDSFHQPLRRHERFHQFQSYFPCFAASFNNQRYSEGINKEVMRSNSNNEFEIFCDELPYIDSDIGRLAMTFTNEDFAFLLNEFSLKVDDLSSKEGVKIIEIVEFGGDHLDAIAQKMNSKNTNNNLANTTDGYQKILKRSVEWIESRGSDQKVTYLVNAKLYHHKCSNRENNINNLHKKLQALKIIGVKNMLFLICRDEYSDISEQLIQEDIPKWMNTVQESSVIQDTMKNNLDWFDVVFKTVGYGYKIVSGILRCLFDSVFDSPDAKCEIIPFNPCYSTPKKSDSQSNSHAILSEHVLVGIASLLMRNHANEVTRLIDHAPVYHRDKRFLLSVVVLMIAFIKGIAERKNSSLKFKDVYVSSTPSLVTSEDLHESLDDIDGLLDLFDVVSKEEEHSLPFFFVIFPKQLFIHMSWGTVLSNRELVNEVLNTLNSVLSYDNDFETHESTCTLKSPGNLLSRISSGELSYTTEWKEWIKTLYN